MKRPNPGGAAAAPGVDPLTKLLRDALGCLQDGRLGEGEALCGRALRLHPGNADAHHLLGLIMHRSGKTEDAIAQARLAIAGNRCFAPFHNSLGTMLAGAGQLEEAARAFQKAIELQPNYPEAISNLGSVFKNARRYDESVQLHRRAIALKPDYPDAHNNLGNTLLRQEEAAAAVEAYRAAVKLRPNHALYRNNLAAALIEDDRLEDAIVECHAALRLQPGYAEGYANLGTALREAGRYDEAIASFGKSLALNPGNSDAIFGESFIDLILGRYSDGWSKYAHRWRWSRALETPRHSAIPAWDGSPLGGRKLLVWDEQGVGDKLMFAAALPSLRDQAENCVVEVEPRLAPLFRRSFPGIEVTVSGGPPNAEAHKSAHDFQAPMADLARWLLPDPSVLRQTRGYIAADSKLVHELRARYRRELGDRPLIGVSWRGGSGKKKRQRSIPLARWAPMLRQAEFGFVSLQYGDVALDLEEAGHAGAPRPFHDLFIDPLKSLDDFAAQTAAMDLVITIDNSTAHMAGALGVPVWVMLPAVPEWRWQLDRTDSVWYPSARLYRQKTRGDWTPVIDQAAAELKNFSPAIGAGAARIRP